MPVSSRSRSSSCPSASLSRWATPDEHVELDVHGDDVAALLDEAEDIINSVGPDILAEFQAEDARRQRGWRKIFRRKR